MKCHCLHTTTINMGVKQDAQASTKESDQVKRNMLNQQLILNPVVATHASVMDYSSMEPQIMGQMPLSWS